MARFNIATALCLITDSKGINRFLCCFYRKAPEAHDVRGFAGMCLNPQTAQKKFPWSMDRKYTVNQQPPAPPRHLFKAIVSLHILTCKYT